MVVLRLNPTSEIWRLPFGQGGVLAFALATVASGTASEDVQIHSLRVIGNSCADTGAALRSARRWPDTYIRDR